MAWSRESVEEVVRASIAWMWSAIILMMTEDRGDDSVVVGVGSDMAVSLVENYRSMQCSIMDGHGKGTESRELTAGCGWGLSGRNGYGLDGDVMVGYGIAGDVTFRDSDRDMARQGLCMIGTGI
jgi:hypothetical protein